MKKMAALFLIFASHRSFSSALTGRVGSCLRTARGLNGSLDHSRIRASTSFWRTRHISGSIFFMAARKSRFVFAVSSSHSIIQTILCPLRHLRFSTALVNIVLCASFSLSGIV